MITSIIYQEVMVHSNLNQVLYMYFSHQIPILILLGRYSYYLHFQLKKSKLIFPKNTEMLS